MGFYGKYRSKRSYRRAVTKSTAGVRSAVGSAFKKRYWHKGGITQLAKDVSMLKGMVNVEKKRHEINSYDNSLGQIIANGNGYGQFEITPLPSQGTGYSGREGSSILFKAFHLALQFRQQNNTLVPIKIDTYIVQTRNGATLDATQMFQANKYIYAKDSVSIIDANSARNPDYFGDFKVLKKKTIWIRQDQASTSQVQTKNVHIGMKFRKGHHVRFSGNSNTPTNSRFFVLMLCDIGNGSALTASSLTAVPYTTQLTGLYYNLDHVSYFIDN